MNENKYQARVIKKLEKLFPGCVVLKNDTSYYQGMPDLTLLWQKHWAALEVKASGSAAIQPNQEHYVSQLGTMSYAAYIYPENEKEVLSALQQAFEPPRGTCVSES